MYDGVDYAEVGRKERIGDIMPDAMPLRDRKPSVHVYVQVCHIGAAVSAGADLVDVHDAGDLPGDFLDCGGPVADFRVHELLQGWMRDLPRDM